MTARPIVVWPLPDERRPPADAPGADVDLAALVAADARPAPDDRPWVVASMVASADGSATDADGRSGGLGGEADRQVFSALRAVADIVLVGAGTVTTEDYGPARPSAATRRQRAARGQTSRPRIAVASASLRIDPGRRLFTDSPAGARPVVITVADADADRRRALEDVADVCVAGGSQIDWATALTLLRHELGARIVLCEGGPSTLAQLVAGDLVDELCLTVAPSLVAGAGPRITSGAAAPTPRRLALERVIVADGDLLLRYVRGESAR